MSFCQLDDRGDFFHIMIFAKYVKRIFAINQKVTIRKVLSFIGLRLFAIQKRVPRSVPGAALGKGKLTHEVCLGFVGVDK